ncbi:MAG: tRNA (N(6)-L-threonylcarbamoyladenosine(37)-C(2))-methylthiotransferase MtaB [Clostridiales bacterium]|jgi:threonylcarbamoyladenosine tRNA methylthiotransferase MtaB|nr:tRNA (N(6)-L-threonylcarbamoyladenosine(37)-C(2))-methylthiotransferase MtaB [Clostridiales bacterium]
MSNYKISFTSLGCKVNSYETTKLQEAFASRGFIVVPHTSPADICIINTCAVTSISSAKSRQAVAKARKISPTAILVVTGCYTELSPNDINADLVFGKDKSHIVDTVCEFLSKHDIPGSNPTTPTMPATSAQFQNTEHHTRAYLKIQDGCNNFCSYCIIPHARGRETSRPFNDCLTEAHTLASQGYNEIVLVGINLSHFCNDNHPALLDLTQAIAEIPTIKRIRLSSLEPNIITEQFAARAASIPKLCPHFHISLQSGCSTTLKRMNRHYDFPQYLAAIRLLQSAMPNVNITTDVIVGFIGETELEHQESMENVKKCGFGKVHVFPYSLRQGTRAATPSFIEQNGGLVPDIIKTTRAKEMRQLGISMESQFLLSQKGKKSSILVEKDNGGYTPNYIYVNLDDGKIYPQNSIVDVII